MPDRLCQGFTASEDAIWACAADALIRIDPATNTITDTVPITGAQYAYRPAAGAGYLWFLGSGDFVADTVIALDTGAKSTRTFQQSGTVGGMAYAFDALWLTSPGLRVRSYNFTLSLGFRGRHDGPAEPDRDRCGSGQPMGPTPHGANYVLRALAGDISSSAIDPKAQADAEFAIGGIAAVGCRGVGRR